MPGKNDLSILTHALLSGLTLLVPIPFLDDWLKAQVQRHMVRDILKSQGVSPTNPEVELLSPDEEAGCLQGCLIGTFFYVIKKFIRQVIPFLEWSRAIQTVSHSYYHGYLVDYAVRKGYYQAGNLRQAARLRYAIRLARQNTNTTFITRGVSQTLSRSRKLLFESARWIGKEVNRLLFHRLKSLLKKFILTVSRLLPKGWREKLSRRIQVEPVADELEQIVEDAPKRRPLEFTQLLNELQKAIAGEPEANFIILEEKFIQALETPTLDLAD